MKRFFAMILALVGTVLTGWGAYGLLVAGGTIYGYHPMYPGLLGVGLLSLGVLSYQE